jgi:hypothetical protein
MTISSYLIALGLTLIIELSVAYALGFRNFKSLISVICVNLISHPLFGYFLWINQSAAFIPINYYSIIALEIIITIGEASLLSFALRQKLPAMLWLSLTMNFASFAIGQLIFKSI